MRAMQENAPEIRPAIETRKQRADYCSAYLQGFERCFRDWVDLAEVLIEVERDKLYVEAGYHSWDAWLVHCAPSSSRLCYLVKGRYENLITDYSPQELRAMPPETAEFVRRQVKPSLRKNPALKAVLTQKRKVAVEAMQREFPDEHFEGIDCRKLKFTDSQAKVFDEGLAAYRAMNNHEASMEEFAEHIVAEWLDSPFESEDVGVSNRDRAHQLEALNASYR